MNDRAITLRTIAAAMLAAGMAAPAFVLDGKKASIDLAENRFKIKAPPWSEDR
jgi:hypothetical protein